MHLPILQDVLILLSFSVLIVFLLQKAKLPSILGFLITGVLIGPHAFSLVSASHDIEAISEIGVILLLFVIGMELSLKQLINIRKTVFIGGLLQVGLTVVISGGVYYVMGFPLSEAVFVGFLFSLSSTAIVLKILQDRNEINAPHGRNALGILIFQDIIVVPMMLFTPIIAGQSTNVGMSVLLLVGKTVLVLLFTLVSARYLVPRLLHAIAKTKSKELFLLTTIALCFLVAFMTSEAGLSLALGAFLAGLIISESEYSHQATSIILPFRELFTSFFFISVGMLLDLQFFIENVAMILLIVLAVFVVKSGIASLAIAVLKYPTRTVLLTGFALFQVGEFSFILSKVGIEYDLLNPQTNQIFLAVSIVSMLLTPFVMMFSEKIADKVLSIPVALKKNGPGTTLNPESNTNSAEQEGGHAGHADYQDHLVVIGYGINGFNVARAAAFSNISYVVIELNATTVQREKKKGIPIVYGDATQDHILEMVNLRGARAAVIAISDPTATKAIITNIRHHSKSLYMLVRTRYIKETSELLALGADDVIPEEFETSVEIFSRVLHNFLVPEDDIQEFSERVRADNYELFKSQKKLPKTFRPAEIPDFNITCLRINRDSGKFLNKALKELDLRHSYGINVLSISRRGEIFNNVKPTDTLKRDDVIYVNGRQKDIEKFHKALN